MDVRTRQSPRQPLWSVAAAEMLLDRVSQGMLTVSWDGKVTYANLTIANMLRVPRLTLLGAAFPELFTEAERPKLLIALGAGRQAVTHQRAALPRADGAELPVHMTFAPLAHGQTSCLVTDLTDQQRRDESAERSSRFLATLALELRSMVRPMQGSLSALKQARTLDEDSCREVESMQRQADRVLALVEDLRNINA